MGARLGIYFLFFVCVVQGDFSHFLYLFHFFADTVGSFYIGYVVYYKNLYNNQNRKPESRIITIFTQKCYEMPAIMLAGEHVAKCL